MEFHTDDCAALFGGDCFCGLDSEGVWEIRLAREHWAAGDPDQALGRMKRSGDPVNTHDYKVDPEIPF